MGDEDYGWDGDYDGYTSPGLGGGEGGAVDDALISEDKPRVLLMGPRRSGKSSIQRVVFNKMSPHETLFLESTNHLDIKYIANNSFVQFQIWDFPGDFDFKDELTLEKAFRRLWMGLFGRPNNVIM